MSKTIKNIKLPNITESPIKRGKMTTGNSVTKQREKLKNVKKSI